MVVSIAAVIVALMVTCGQGLDNGLAKTPIMGWLNWERFRCHANCDIDPENCISEKLFKTMADLIVSEGYKDVGYEYVDIDDCWPEHKRDEQGRLQANKERFPSGMKSLADYMHKLGLKLGIYEDFGTRTCVGLPGSEFHLQIDAETFANWTIDLLKFDGCNSDPHTYEKEYPPMAFFLERTGRPIVFSCEYPVHQLKEGLQVNYTKVAGACNMARNHHDVQDSWDSVLKIIEFYGENEGGFAETAGPGYWNDPDQLVIGNFGLSYDQQRTQMAMWCIMASPLLMSVDLRTIGPMSKALLQNRGAIGINQDSLGKQGKRIHKIGNIQVWTRPIIPKPSMAFVVLNTGGAVPAKVSMKLSDIGLTDLRGYDVWEVFDSTHIGLYQPRDYFNCTVNPTGVFFGKAVIT